MSAEDLFGIINYCSGDTTSISTALKARAPKMTPVESYGHMNACLEVHGTKHAAFKAI